MNIEQQFNLIAKEYDEKRRFFIPCFDDFYDETTKFIASNIKAPKRFLDLGAGTGLLSAYWYSCFPNAEYYLVDIAEEMLEAAKKRFDGLKNVFFEVSDYSETLPDGDFDVIASALSVHHLEDESKIELFGRICKKLPSRGMFVNYDQFCAGDEELNRWYDLYWENSLKDGRLSENDLQLWKERRMLDKECSVEKEIKMLRESGFRTVKCVYSNLKFSVITAFK